jgi:hypothetical protein
MADANVDQQFHLLHNELVAAYEKNLKRERDQREQLATLRERHHEQTREIMSASQLDMERLDRLAQEDEEALKDLLREVRQPMIERSTQQAEDAKRFSLRSSLPIPNLSKFPVYATTLLATNHAHLEENPGTKGNPWILPWNPSKVKITASMGGDGWGCGSRALGITENAQAVFWFAFIPPATAMWHLLALVNLHGYYIIRANDEWWNCKTASVSVGASVDVFQYYWNGARGFDLLEVSGDNISANNLWDGWEQFDYQTGLRAGDWAFVKVMISLDAYAQGGGSYSELNFSTGLGNYIEPVILFVW